MKKRKMVLSLMGVAAVIALLNACSTQRLASPAPADVNITVDTTNPHLARETLYDMWQVANRISPKNGVQVRPGMKVNTVRMVGGINKKVNGVKTKTKTKKVPDTEYDLAFFDEKTQAYVYNFKPLTQRINAIINGGTPIHQLVLDQPPWAFQRGYTFIPNDQKDGVNFREKERVSIYGNSLPPYDLNAYSDFISALMRHLVNEYGAKTVASWRLRVGSEIETPDHWYGTEQEFIAYFAATVKAIRAVLPSAKVGVHTRDPRFVYRNGTITNYKNQVIRSFANAIIEYCHDNNIRYDFWGVSDYPILSLEHTRDPKQKFETLFSDLVNHPKWQKGTVIDLEEFSVVSFIKGSQLITSDTAQSDSFMVAMTDTFLTHGVDQVFQWGQREPSHELWRTESLKNMAGKVRYQADIQSATAIKKAHNTEPSYPHLIGAIIAKDPQHHHVDALIYHYNPKNITATYSKTVHTHIAVAQPAGTTYKYRHRIAGVKHRKFQNFMAQPQAQDGLKEGEIYTRYGNPHKVLNKAGLAKWASYVNPHPSVWSEWKQGVTLPNKAGLSNQSVVSFYADLPVFSFEKVEIRWP